MKPSLTTIGTTIFFLFVARSIHSIYYIWKSPECSPGDICYHSFFNDKPELDLLVFVTFVADSASYKSRLLVLNAQKFDYESPYEKEITMDLPEDVRQNGVILIHTVFVPSSNKINYQPSKGLLNKVVNANDAKYIKGNLTQFAIPQSTTFNLLDNDDKVKQSDEPVTHLRGRYAIIMCPEILNLPHKDIPYEIVREMRINPKSQFLPIAREDTFNMRLKDLVEIKPTTDSVTFTFTYNPVSLGKMRFYIQMEATLTEFLALGFTEKDLDEVKGVFGDTNLFLLCATMAIGSVHLLLDFLSFKNDVSFWKSQTSMAGLSTRTVLWRAFSQGVVFLFLLDQGTSLLVLIPAGIASLIEIWKVTKVWKTNMSVSLRGISFKRDSSESAAEAETRKYDEECMRYLSYLLYPLCVAAAVYSLIYEPHKSFYSWTINSLVNGVYAFGFLFMLPQLFINYRLKSVAALPWRAFTYRAFNTFIDDVFAFIITMPTAHRLACFRDDVIFLVYLYQRWLYPVDTSRVEGVSGEVVPEDIQETKKDQ